MKYYTDKHYGKEFNYFANKKQAVAWNKMTGRATFRIEEIKDLEILLGTEIKLEKVEKQV